MHLFLTMSTKAHTGDDRQFIPIINYYLNKVALRGIFKAEWVPPGATIPLPPCCTEEKYYHIQFSSRHSETSNSSHQ